MTTRGEVKKAVREILPAGVSMSPIACCGNCASAQVQREVADMRDDVSVVFWNAQSDDTAFGEKDYRVLEWDEDGEPAIVEDITSDEDEMVGELYLMWWGDPDLIETALRAEGLDVERPNTIARTFIVRP